jgi:tyrosyl-tRNA synthetase
LKNVFDVFVERGFVAQVTDEEPLRDLLQNNKVAFYIGFDPTADSFHIGSLVPIMALAHMQRHGHRPVVLIGGGTGLIGDPSGKTEMRQLLTYKQIDDNARSLQNQLSRYVDFRDGKALLLNNADWLCKLNYLEFLRDIGRHFSVNKMLAAESYKMRLEKGLNLIEFNYMLLQAYDFLYLSEHNNCLLQMGGNDQWGNIVAGIDLIRRVKGKTAYGLTFPLLTTSRGHKMGKTEKGAVWLDPSLTTPYDYYQYWINTDDADVGKFLSLFTFLPIEEINDAHLATDKELNMSKAVLAFEATKITHGEDAALGAFDQSTRYFGFRSVEAGLLPSSAIQRADVRRTMHGKIPAVSLAASGHSSLPIELVRLEAGIPAFELFHEAGVCASKGEARRVLSQGGGYVNDRQIVGFDEKIGINQVNENGEIILRKGKKKYFIVTLENA